jgi:RNA polymerase sigma factor (sigma-70 family)
MKVSEKSRLLSRTKAPKAAKPPRLRKRLDESAVGSFRQKLDWHWLCGCIRMRGVWGAEAEDLAQEALLVAARIQARPRPAPRPGQTEQQARRALLRRIVRDLVWSYFRRRDQRRTDPCEDIERFAGDTPRSDELLIAQEEEREQQRRSELLEAGLAHLSRKAPKAHAVLEAHELGGESVVAIAARLAIPLGTAHTRLRKGRAKLSACVQRYHAGGRRWPAGARCG